MSSAPKLSSTMMPISGRLPDDLYQWLSTTPLDGATTVSDKIRVAVTTLKRLHEGNSDYIGALGMQRDLTRGTRDQIAVLERATGIHSEVLAVLMEQVPVLAAILNSAQVAVAEDACHLEDQLVRRSLALGESLLRQTLVAEAAAYDVHVLRNNSSRLVDILRALSRNHSKGEAGG